LNLSYNKITEISSTLSLLQGTLKQIILTGNPLKNPDEQLMSTSELMTLLVARQKEKKIFGRYGEIDIKAYYLMKFLRDR
jgi:hypothetical protein